MLFSSVTEDDNKKAYIDVFLHFLLVSGRIRIQSRTHNYKSGSRWTKYTDHEHCLQMNSAFYYSVDIKVILSFYLTEKLFIFDTFTETSSTSWDLESWLIFWRHHQAITHPQCFEFVARPILPFSLIGSIFLWPVGSIIRSFLSIWQNRSIDLAGKTQRFLDCLPWVIFSSSACCSSVLVAPISLEVAPCDKLCTRSRHFLSDVKRMESDGCEVCD